MPDLAFYNAGTEPARGLKRAVVPARRALRRVLRPIFARQVEILQSICDRIEAAEAADRGHRAEVDAHLARVDEQLQMTLAFGWDYAALVRRLATLEDRVEALSPPTTHRVAG